MSQNNDDFIEEYDGEVPDFISAPSPVAQGGGAPAVQAVQTAAPVAQAGQTEGQPARWRPSAPWRPLPLVLSPQAKNIPKKP